MAFEIYQHELNSSKADRGHDGECPYVNNHSPACDCDYNKGDQYEIPNALKTMGWKRDPSMPKYSWYRQWGPHHLTITKVISGWQYMWIKRSGMTLLEHGGFGTPMHAIDHLMGTIATRMDWFTKVSWEHGAMRSQLSQVGIEPRELGKKEEHRKPAPAGLLKHEVAAIMDEKGKISVTANKPK